MMKKLLILSVLTLFMQASAWAYEFEVVNDEGVTIYYNILSYSERTCEVTYKGYYYYSEASYSGNVSIPETVEYYGVTYSVTTIGDYAFYACTGLTSVTIPNSVTSIGEYTFYRCTALTQVTIPESVISIGNGAFQNCNGITQVTIPEGVATMGIRTFQNCTTLTEVNFNAIACNSDFSSSSNRIFDGCANIATVNLGENVTIIPAYLCYELQELTEIIIPNSVTIIGEYAFYNCKNMKSVLTIPEGVTSIGEYAFYYCKSMKGALIIPKGVTKIGDYAFYYCSSLTDIISIPDSVSEIGSYAFAYCSGLTGTLTIPESVALIGGSAFYGCSSLTGTLTIPGGVTEISNGTFQSCTGLTSVTIPEDVTMIGSSAFAGCSGLTEITIPNSVTEIGGSAFLNCSGMTSVTIGESITSIGRDAFYGCKGLISIYTLNPEPPTCGSTSTFYNVDKKTCVLYVPDGTLEEYSSAYAWEDFLNIVEFDVTPVSSITANGNAEAINYYTTDGKQVSALQRGINIIHYSDGTARKVLSK